MSHATGYQVFFVYSATLSIPGLLLLFWLWRRSGAGMGLSPLALADAGGNARVSSG